MKKEQEKKEKIYHWEPKVTNFISAILLILLAVGAVLGIFSGAWGVVFQTIGWNVVANPLLNIGDLLAPQGVLAWVFLAALLIPTGIIIDFIRFCIAFVKYKKMKFK